MNKEVRKIFVVLALYALSGGIFYNFQELWLAQNNLSLTTIGTVLSLGSVISVSVIFLCTSIIKQRDIKKYTCIFLLIKALLLFSLFILNGSGLNIIIKFITIVDFALDTQIYTFIYPMITVVTKSDKLYAMRGIIYDALYYIGVVFVGFMLGKSIGMIIVDYNLYCLIAGLLMIISFVVLLSCKLDKYYKKNEEKHDYAGFGKLIKGLKNDKISIYY